VALILAILFGARAILEVAWYRYRSRATKRTHVGWGPDRECRRRPLLRASRRNDDWARASVMGTKRGARGVPLGGPRLARAALIDEAWRYGDD